MFYFKQKNGKIQISNILNIIYYKKVNKMSLRELAQVYYNEKGKFAENTTE